MALSYVESTQILTKITMFYFYFYFVMDRGRKKIYLDKKN